MKSCSRVINIRNGKKCKLHRSFGYIYICVYNCIYNLKLFTINKHINNIKYQILKHKKKPKFKEKC